MSDVWCWLGLADCASRARDVARATPELSPEGLVGAVVLVVGVLLILTDLTRKGRYRA